MAPCQERNCCKYSETAQIGKCYKYSETDGVCFLIMVIPEDKWGHGVDLLDIFLMKEIIWYGRIICRDAMNWALGLLLGLIVCLHSGWGKNYDAGAGKCNV